jgi:hypothetical protein
MAVNNEDMDALVEHLKVLARTEHAARTPAKGLDMEHCAVLVRAITNVLSTEVALFT